MTNNRAKTMIQDKEHKRETQYHQAIEHIQTGRQRRVKDYTHDTQESNQARRQNINIFLHQGAEERNPISPNTQRTPQKYLNLSLSQNDQAKRYVNPQEHSKKLLTDYYARVQR